MEHLQKESLSCKFNELCSRKLLIVQRELRVDGQEDLMTKNYQLRIKAFFCYPPDSSLDHVQRCCSLTEESAESVFLVRCAPVILVQYRHYLLDSLLLNHDLLAFISLPALSNRESLLPFEKRRNIPNRRNFEIVSLSGVCQSVHLHRKPDAISGYTAQVQHHLQDADMHQIYLDRIEVLL